ncbi:MAG: hypothetical protein ACPG32_00890 [Akkermansiaceae bacterium]
MKAIRFLRAYGFLFLIYVVFLTSLVIFCFKKHRYSGVETWPSVLAENVDITTLSFPSRGDSHYGTKPHTTETYEILHFSYTVEGVSYRGNTSNANDEAIQRPLLYLPNQETSLDSNHNGSVPFHVELLPWRAYYHPENPHIAVLEPVPYQGTVAILLMVFAGIIMVVHFWTVVRK